MFGPTRLTGSRREAEGDAGANGHSSGRLVTERIHVDSDIPPTVESDPSHLTDLARDPLRRPLVTLVAAVVVCTLAAQSYLVAVTAGPVAGLLAVAAVAVAYAVARRCWAVQHRHMVAELAAANELDRLR